ncbi:MAG TPA: tRNA (adenosine(37)-N6)-threonylcarbamoyltransferase complex transferase subunit TsaD [Solirubrobacteraceae bacterium]|nr:tRNA (adenosine(37)-N6)-threonylcarbamoyltransferase complex transferase subunit TsaD [Solirubrobacteraceae bacterium]
MILAIETSCDDTCAALVTREGEIAASVISSQEAHNRFGGVVPEVAARDHIELLDPVIDEAFARAGGASLDDVELVAATRGPGLVGALLVGFQAAKAIAAARELPFAPVDHLAGHVAAARLAPARFEPPFVALVASGGHTLLLAVREHGAEPEILARTLDDAAGEAFDKGARMLGLGYPGGAALERLAAGGDDHSYDFPSGRGEDFSFAGLKTALLYRTREVDATDERVRADLAASYQRAIVEALVRRAARALERTGLRRLALGGGVAANGALRGRLEELGVELFLPPLALCTDNAAMIAAAALEVEPIAYPGYLELDVYATGEGPLR